MYKRVESAPLGAKKVGRMGDSKQSIPFAVTMLVKPSFLETELKPVLYFVRANNPHNAGMMAYKLWSKWEKFDIGLSDRQYPDIEDGGAVECLDEDDFRTAYKDIVKHKLPHAAAGNPKDPSAFTCFGRTQV